MRPKYARWSNPEPDALCLLVAWFSNRDLGTFDADWRGICRKISE